MRRWRALAAIIGIAVLIGMAITSGRGRFPRPYASRLDELRLKHPNWTFEPLVVHDLTWAEVLAVESTPGWNLVPTSANYAKYAAENAKRYDSGNWCQASREAIAYFLDPRNFLNERDIFMFEDLSFNPDIHSVDAIERSLKQSFMGKCAYDGGTNRFSALLLEIGREIDLSPVFLASRLAIEQGKGTVQAFGKIGDAIDNPEANGYYNFFNIRACGNGLTEIRRNAWKEAAEANARYHGPWTNQELAVRGGALKVKEEYVATRRHTRYLQKFSVDPSAGKSRWRQYMQNLFAPLNEARIAERAYREEGTLNSPHHFIIPVFRRLPSTTNIWRK